MRLNVETPELRALLAGMMQRVVAEGGIVHPGLCIHQQGDQLFITCAVTSRAERPEVLLRLPGQLLVPAAGLHCDDDDWQRIRGAEHLSALQREMLDAMLAIYVSSGKPAFARKHLPALALAPGGELKTMLLSCCPGSMASTTSLEAFLNSRLLTQRDSGCDVLMPLLELVNHHEQAPGFRAARADGLRMMSCPRGPLDECFVSYGRRDVLDMWLVYGFAAEDATMVSCAPGQHERPGPGWLRIEGRGHGEAHDLPLCRREPGGLALSHVNLHLDAAEEDRARLGLLLRALEPSRQGAALEAALDVLIDSLIAREEAHGEALARLAADPAQGSAEALATLSRVLLLRRDSFRALRATHLSGAR